MRLFSSLLVTSISLTNLSFPSILATSSDLEEEPKLQEEQDFTQANLHLSNKGLTSFDPSSYSNLDILDISNNELKSLDLSKNELLSELDCSHNQLEVLILTQNSVLWSLDCSYNCLPALDLGAPLYLMAEDCNLSPQEIILPKNLTTLNLETQFSLLDVNRMKNISSDKNIIFNPTTGELSGITPNSKFSYSYEPRKGDLDLVMEVTISFTGEEDPTLSNTEEPVSNPDPLPPFTGGNAIKDDTDPTIEEKQIAMHRLYNPNTGEHLYTSDTNERDTLTKIGWNSEGIGWYAPETSSIPVYRLYNPITEGGDHHYTMDLKERDALRILGWKYENIGWYSAIEKGTNSVPLYREYNPNQYSANHNYTTDRHEHLTLVGLGWKDEGTAWYGLKPAS